MNGGGVANMFPEWIAKISGKTWEIALYITFLVYVGILLSQAITYPPDARLVPFITGSLLFGLIVIRLLTLTLSDRLPVRVTGLFDEMTEEFTDHLDETNLDASMRYRREVETILWVSLFLVMVWFVGFLISIALYTPLFVYYHTRDARLAVVSTLVIISLVYLLFSVILSSSLWEGVLF